MQLLQHLRHLLAVRISRIARHERPNGGFGGIAPARFACSEGEFTGIMPMQSFEE